MKLALKRFLLAFVQDENKRKEMGCKKSRHVWSVHGREIYTRLESWAVSFPLLLLSRVLLLVHDVQVDKTGNPFIYVSASELYMNIMLVSVLSITRVETARCAVAKTTF